MAAVVRTTREPSSTRDGEARLGGRTDELAPQGASRRVLPSVQNGDGLFQVQQIGAQNVNR